MLSRLVLLALLFGLAGPAAIADEVSFSRDVKPILTNRCFRCHGPDDATLEAGLRLDERGIAVAALESGVTAIVPGKPDESELIARVTSADGDVRMPPEGAGDPLTPAEVDVLRRWIAAGAKYERHWAWVGPVRPQPPVVPPTRAARASIDAFVDHRLAGSGLDPNVEADRWVLARRVAVDLTGLPPTVDRARAFVEDTRPDAYERYVDELLASPAFGERWGRVWLDLARYADSAGYAQDPSRTIWRYRDWVIAALNANQPFDEFTIEQLAADMLPDPTDDQLLATAFHRNTMTNSEGGTNDEEFRNAAIVDRVNTTMQVWMGVTMGCAQCHTHKYDPITQREYFQLFAILNNTEDADRGNEEPNLYVLTDADHRRRADLERRIAELEKVIAEKTAGDAPSKPTEPDAPLRTRYLRVQLLGKGTHLHLAEVQAFVGEENVALKGTASQISTGFDGPAKYGIDGNTDGTYTNKSVFHTERADDPWWEVDFGEPRALTRVAVWNRTDNGTAGRLKQFRVIALDENRVPQWVHVEKKTPNPSTTFDLPATRAGLSDADRKTTLAYAIGNSGAAAEETKQRDALKKQLVGIKGVPTPIMRELPMGRRRTTRVQIRGNFLVTGEEVRPGVPEEFHDLPAGIDEPTRLDLARWIVADENPLTARVAVNRIWEQLFGRGLVVTSEDFGVQGELPSHPQLLDWLATEYVRTGWDTKRLLRTIVTSATYRRSSRATEQAIEIDPDNQWLARGPSFRLPAEAIRDQALTVGRLLSRKMNGPSVRPPRPKLGLRAAFGGSTDWEPSPGEDRFRRGLYTTWRRTTPYPSFMTFDATSREVCTIRRVRTNTPLQALVTLNDPVYVEAAQAMGRRLLAEAGPTLADRITFGFQLCVTRPPTDAERIRLERLYATVRDELAEFPEDAKALATDPIGPAPDGIGHVELATWTVVCNVLMNLDEFLARK